MRFKIGFADNSCDKNMTENTSPKQKQIVTPRKSVVQVRFAGRSSSLAYYNDRFDLKPGDLVYVDGKLEGQPGRVTEVNYTFKIEDYANLMAQMESASSEDEESIKITIGASVELPPEIDSIVASGKSIVQKINWKRVCSATAGIAIAGLSGFVAGRACKKSKTSPVGRYSR